MESKYNYLKITCNFGERINPISKLKEFHTGIDFRPNNLETYALIDGIVRLAKKGNYGEGNFLQIKTFYKNTMFYCNYFHNEKLLKKVNDNVKKDEVIAISGNTGNSTGIHIHLEVFTYNKNTEFIKELQKKCKYFNAQDSRLFFDPLEFIKNID